MHWAKPGMSGRATSFCIWQTTPMQTRKFASTLLKFSNEIRRQRRKYQNRRRPSMFKQVAFVLTLLLLVVQCAGAADVSSVSEQTLVETLKKKIDVIYRRDSLQWVLDDLREQSGLRCVHPPT